MLETYAVVVVLPRGGAKEFDGDRQRQQLRQNTDELAVKSIINQATNAYSLII